MNRDNKELRQKLQEYGERIEKLEEAVFKDTGTLEPRSKKKLSLVEFLNDHNVSTHKEKILVIGYYLENYKDQDNFTSEEIKSHYKKAKLKPPANPSDIIFKTAGEGYLMEDGESNGVKKWILTRTGEYKVTDELKEADE